MKSKRMDLWTATALRRAVVFAIAYAAAFGLGGCMLTGSQWTDALTQVADNLISDVILGPVREAAQAQGRSGIIIDLADSLARSAAENIIDDLIPDDPQYH